MLSAQVFNTTFDACPKRPAQRQAAVPAASARWSSWSKFGPLLLARHAGSSPAAPQSPARPTNVGLLSDVVAWRRARTGRTRTRSRTRHSTPSFAAHFRPQNYQTLRATGAELRIRGVLTPLRDPQCGPFAGSGTELRVVCARVSGETRAVSERPGAADHKIQASSVRQVYVRRRGVSQPLLRDDLLLGAGARLCEGRRRRRFIINIPLFITVSERFYL